MRACPQPGGSPQDTRTWTILEYCCTRFLEATSHKAPSCIHRYLQRLVNEYILTVPTSALLWLTIALNVAYHHTSRFHGWISNQSHIRSRPNVHSPFHHQQLVCNWRRADRYYTLHTRSFLESANYLTICHTNQLGSPVNRPSIPTFTVVDSVSGVGFITHTVETSGCVMTCRFGMTRLCVTFVHI